MAFRRFRRQEKSDTGRGRDARPLREPRTARRGRDRGGLYGAGDTRPGQEVAIKALTAHLTAKRVEPGLVLTRGAGVPVKEATGCNYFFPPLPLPWP